jgi:hypothetical protein
MVLKSYFEYYHGSRTHLGLGKDCPVSNELASSSVPRSDGVCGMDT